MMVLMEITTWHDIENGHHIDNDDNDGFVEELSGANYSDCVTDG